MNIASQKAPIYLDNHASTQLDPQVFEQMLPFLKELYGNSSSSSNWHGKQSQLAVNKAREQVAKAINADTDEIIFTSGATESINMVLQGLALRQKKKLSFLSVATEHKSVLETLQHLQNLGHNINILAPTVSGHIDYSDFVDLALDKKAFLISVMHVNNEIGTINPINKIGNFCRKNGFLFHCDAAQSMGRQKIDVKKDHIDFLSLSSHKLYGPKGVGALYINKEMRNMLSPIIFGGGQESGFRCGSLNVPAIVGFGFAAQRANALLSQDNMKIAKMRDYFTDNLRSNVSGIKIYGCIKERVAGNINIGIDGVNAASLLGELYGKISFSAASACSSQSTRKSHVLKAIGVDEYAINEAIRLCFGRFNTMQDVENSLEYFIAAISKLRNRSPRWRLLNL